MSTSSDRLKARRDALLSQRGDTATVVLVTGPPCSGKTSHVKANAVPGDVVIDFDALATALGSPDSHDHPKTLIPVVMAAWDAALKESRRHSGTVWLVRGFPTANDFAGAHRVVRLDVPAEICKARAVVDGRPDGWVDVIDRWWTTFA